MRLLYLAKAVSKRDLKLDRGEDVFEANDMVKWEEGWTLYVEGKIRVSHGSVCVRLPQLPKRVPRDQSLSLNVER